MAHASRRALRALLSMRFLCFNELDLILIQGTSAKKNVPAARGCRDVVRTLESVFSGAGRPWPA